jgi:hypothetical protein
MVSISLFFHMILSKKVVAFLKIMLSRSSQEAGRPARPCSRASAIPTGWQTSSFLWRRNPACSRHVRFAQI